MKSVVRLVGPLALLVLAGCRSGNTAQFDELYSELRMWEDEVAIAEAERDEAEARLESSRRENAALRKQLAQREPGSPAADDPVPAGPPAIEIPGETYPPGELPAPPGTVPGGEAPRYVPPNGAHPMRYRGKVRQAPQVSLIPRRQEAEITDWNVAEITLNRQMTGGHNRDGRPGDEGLIVVVEPRNAAGQIIDVPGAISVVVVDSERPGPEGRVARWDFDSNEAAELFQQTIVGKGIHVELPWPAAPPVGRALTLYVRYTADDGRKHLAERQIQVDPLEQEHLAQPAAPRRPARPSGDARRAPPQVVADESWEESEPMAGPLLAPPATDEWPEERTARRNAPQEPPDNDASYEKPRRMADREVEPATDEQIEPPPAPRRKRPTWSPDR